MVGSILGPILLKPYETQIQESPKALLKGVAWLIGQRLRIDIPLLPVVTFIAILLLLLWKRVGVSALVTTVRKVTFRNGDPDEPTAIPRFRANAFDGWQAFEGPRIPSSVLDKPNGAVAVWAKVTDYHSTVTPKAQRHKYILAHATHEGKLSGNSTMAKYPNAWAIVRRMPITTDDSGQWSFWANGMGKEELHIDTSELLAPGWHLFTVEWSRQEDFIRFYIDRDSIGQRSFMLWPQGFSESITVGTWQDDWPHFQFKSNVGPCYACKRPMTAAELNNLMESRPIPV